MNEELQKALGELLSKANNGIDAAGVFLAAELPDVIQQLLMWHAVKSLITFVLCLLIPFIIYRVSINVARKTFLKEGNDAFEFPHMIIPMVFIGIIAPTICLAKINIVWLQIWLAPKVWLIEYAAKLSG